MGQKTSPNAEHRVRIHHETTPGPSYKAYRDKMQYV